MIKWIFLWVWLLPTLLSAQKQNVFQVNERLGKGINLGNMFEAPSEEAWGNPFREEYIAQIAELGFEHVRIPIRWDTPERTLMQSPYTIQPEFFERVSQVVQLCLDQGLLVIINMHHHDDLFQNPNLHKERFLAQWQQISEYFKDFTEDLLFEVMNEPHDELTPELWNQYFSEALTLIRKENPERVVLMGTAEFGGVSGIFSLEPPVDEHLIVTVHYYDPFTFTHQGADWVGEHTYDWLGTNWYDLTYEREGIASQLEPLVKFSENHNIPIHIGEFGAYEKADMDSRIRWTNFVARHVESLGFSWAYWEWSAGFGIYDPTTNTLREELANALLHSPLLEARESYPQTIYEANFEESTEGWNLLTQSGAQASLHLVDDHLQISIQQTGSEGWHVQLSKGNITLEEGQIYGVSFTAYAEDILPVTQYLGQNTAPFSSYTGYQGFQIEESKKTFSYVFTMNSPTDENSRAVFDLGSLASNIRLESFKIERLDFLVASLPRNNPESKTEIYPNPFWDFLTIEQAKQGDRLEIYDLKGRKFQDHTVIDRGRVNLSYLPAGVYLIRIKEVQGHWIRVIKK
ncbi:cellulase family glycosylhydrolase [Pleomorphovibrio marinus]|uniref:cellulase family glycosylhydrolase n=1 Tax=Pleomorphovibrio marinus TaxID=2164132 RepID=UPI000E0A9D55|nr:cellulase family glycosylhydrolase [Pleomorphovibrio marinus]